MTRFASFDHTVTPPCPVTGWYDTDLFTYPVMPPGYNLQEVTDNTFWTTGRFVGQWGVAAGAFVDITPAPPAGPTVLQQQASAALFAGIQLTSIATPALDGSYAVDPGTVARINGIIATIAGGLGLPGGGATFLWKDTSGGDRAFSQTNFKNFAAAVMNYSYTLNRIIGGTVLALPDFNITIA